MGVTFRDREAIRRIRYDPTRRRLVGAVLRGGFAATVALAATLSTAAAVAELFGAEHPLNVTYALLGWLRKRLSVSDVGATTLARVALNKALVQNRNLQKEPSCFDTQGGRNVDRDDVGEG